MESLKTLIKIASFNRSRTAPIIRAIKFQGNTATSTDLILWAHIVGDWHFDEPAVVSIDRIKGALSLAKKPVWEGAVLNGVDLSIPDFDAADFPDAPASPTPYEELQLSVPLADALDYLMPAMGSQDIRYYLNGLAVDYKNGAMVATNGHRLHIVDAVLNCTDADYDVRVIPRQLLDVVKTPTSIKLSQSHAILTFDGGYVAAHLIDGKFPDWLRVVPDAMMRPSSIILTPQHLAAIKLVHGYNKTKSGQFGAVRLYDGVALSGDGVAKAEFPGVDVAINFNATYLIDAYREGAIMSWGDAIKNVLITHGNYIAVIMPMRV
jgi:DNA polymerase-3 subunit beta